MHIEISGHHVTVTDSIRETVNQKLEKINSHFPQVEQYKVILTVEPNIQKAEISTQFLGLSISVEAKKSDLYLAITDAVKKLDTKLKHRKGASTSNRHHKPLISEPDDSLE